MKTSFLSNMTHEFRTPLNAILALSQLLLDRTDGALTAEQAKQVGYIRQSGESLLELVNDLLDLAKIEAGRIDVRPTLVNVSTLFSALRGMLKPLLVSAKVALLFEEPDGLPLMTTDEGKVSQILRNFVSNALKFTEQGNIRVRAELTDDRQCVRFSVSDTGIGINETDQLRIFDEFTQIENPIQHKVKGTGLGLPLCRKLATLLGGSVGLTSRVGTGSTFVATIPIVYSATFPNQADVLKSTVGPTEDGRLPVLVVEDEPETRLLYESYLRRTPFHIIPAGNLAQARELFRRHRVAAIILDILLPCEDAWEWLAELKGSDDSKTIPILIASSVDDPRKCLALGAEAYCAKPVPRGWLLERLQSLTDTDRDGLSASPTVWLSMIRKPIDTFCVISLMK